MSTATVKVSIGMPVYNGGKYLYGALSSLLNQTHKDIEIIISDNASDDDTPEICTHFTKQDRRVKHFRQNQNIGAVANFNFVLENAEGAYFMWAAHDDQWDRDYVRILLEQILNGYNVTFAYGQSMFINEDGIIYSKAINNYFKTKWLRNDPANAPLINAIAYYIDRSPFKFYGLYEKSTLNREWLRPFLGSSRYFDNVFLLNYLSRHNAIESTNAIHFYRVHKRPADYYIEPGGAGAPSHIYIELRYFFELICILAKFYPKTILMLAPGLGLLLIASINRPLIILIKNRLITRPTRFYKRIMKQDD